MSIETNKISKSVKNSQYFPKMGNVVNKVVVDNIDLNLITIIIDIIFILAVVHLFFKLFK